MPFRRRRFEDADSAMDFSAMNKLIRNFDK